MTRQVGQQVVQSGSIPSNKRIEKLLRDCSTCGARPGCDCRDMRSDDMNRLKKPHAGR